MLLLFDLQSSDPLIPKYLSPTTLQHIPQESVSPPANVNIPVAPLHRMVGDPTEKKQNGNKWVGPWAVTFSRYKDEFELIYSILECDVKSNTVLRNGCGSKELELTGTPTTTLKGDIEKGVTSVQTGTSQKADFEGAIEQAGYGKFHYLLLAVCGFVSTSEEMDVISMSFILPSAQCDLNLNTQAKGWLNSIIFIGMMAGAYVWGSIADSLGRKKVLIAISFMNALCIVASSFSQTYELFMFFRFLNGAALVYIYTHINYWHIYVLFIIYSFVNRLGGSGPVIWSYFAEFQPKSKRGSMLSFMAAFWTLGNLFVASLAWLIIPTDIGYKSPAFLYNSWRIFLLICSFPSFIVAGLLLFLPESPKFLLSRGRTEEALCIFKEIYRINTGNNMKDYPVKELIVDEHFCMSNLNNDVHKEPVKVKGKYMTMMGDIMDNSKQLFMSPILRFTLISVTINFTFHIG